MNRIFKRIMMATGIAAMATTLAACGPHVSVEPGHAGKKMDSSGYQDGTISPSTLRLNTCAVFGVCEKLVTLDTTDFQKTVEYDVFMPEDKLNLTYSLSVTLAPKPEAINKFFDILPPRRIDDRLYRIPVERGYETYVQPLLDRKSRDFLTQYSIMEIANNRQRVSNELSAYLSKEISENTMYYAKMVDLAGTEYPSVITDAQVNAAERREAIQQEEAQKEVNRVQMEKKLELAQLQRTIDVEKAQAEAEVNKIISESMTPAYVQYRELQALDNIANSTNTKFVPTDLLNNMAGQVMVGNAAK